MRKLAVLATIVMSMGPAYADLVAKPDHRVWIGVSIDQGRSGVRITEVIRQTPADEADLWVDDEILSVSGVQVRTPAEMIRAVSQLGDRDSAELIVTRDGKKHLVQVALEEFPQTSEILRRRLVGLAAPSVKMSAANSNGFSLASLRGEVVVVFFPSVRQDPAEIADLVHNTVGRERDARVLLVSRTPLAPVSSTVGIHVVQDTDGAITKAFQIPAAPSVLVVDRRGIVCFAAASGGGNVDGAGQSQVLLEHALFAVRSALTLRASTDNQFVLENTSFSLQSLY